MLNAQELKYKINENHIILLLHKLGSVNYIELEESFIFKTICHHGDSAKLYYYKDSKQFYCYSGGSKGCGNSFDIIELVCRSKNYSFIEAINWICVQLNFSTLENDFGHGNKDMINDWEFIHNIRSKRKKNTKTISKSDFYDKSILNIFQKMYLKEWIDEGISINSMYKYGILYSTLQQKIVIPHYDMEDNLLGIRTRAILEEDIDKGKYTPLNIGNVTYAHPLSQNLYGLNINKEAIKKKRKIMLVEAEKGVQQCDTMFGDNNFTVALCGQAFSNYQRDLILSLDVNEVIIALDKQFHDPNSKEADKFAKYIRERIINKLAPYVTTTILWDTKNLLPYKASPTDLGMNTLLRLMDKKIYTGCL